MAKRETFEEKCRRVSDATEIDLSFYYDKDRVGREDDAFEDDGTLHIVNGKTGMRACFDVNGNQNRSASSQNRRTRAVMDAMGLPLTKRVLEDEADDDQDA